MNVSRRSFLGGALTIGLASSAPARLLAANIPIIYGDGIHDDTAGLQAAIDGKPFRVFGQHHAVQALDGSVMISGGSYLISMTLVLRDVTITGGHFQATRDFRGNCLLEVHGKSTLVGMHLDCRNADWGIVDKSFCGVRAFGSHQHRLIGAA